jgi:hypothetical protein
MTDEQLIADIKRRIADGPYWSGIVLPSDRT